MIGHLRTVEEDLYGNGILAVGLNDRAGEIDVETFLWDVDHVGLLGRDGKRALLRIETLIGDVEGELARRGGPVADSRKEVVGRLVLHVEILDSAGHLTAFVVDQHLGIVAAVGHDGALRELCIEPCGYGLDALRFALRRGLAELGPEGEETDVGDLQADHARFILLEILRHVVGTLFGAGIVCGRQGHLEQGFIVGPEGQTLRDRHGLALVEDRNLHVVFVVAYHRGGGERDGEFGSGLRLRLRAVLLLPAVALQAGGQCERHDGQRQQIFPDFHDLHHFWCYEFRTTR